VPAYFGLAARLPRFLPCLPRLLLAEPRRLPGRRRARPRFPVLPAQARRAVTATRPSDRPPGRLPPPERVGRRLTGLPGSVPDIGEPRRAAGRTHAPHLPRPANPGSVRKRQRPELAARCAAG